MKREKLLLKNTMIITVGNVCTKLISFFLLPLYTSVLTTEEYGIVDLLNTMVILLLPIITFQVEQAIFRELIEVRNNEKRKTEIITTSIITVIFQIFFYIILFLIISPLIKNDYKIFLVSNVITQIFLSIFLQISRGLGNNKIYAVGSFLNALFTILFNILFLVFLKLGAYGMLLGTMIGQLLSSCYIFIFMQIYKYINIKKYKKAIIKKLWKYSIPLIPNAISWWVFNASDRIIVSCFLGVDQNGVLAVSLKFSAIIITLYNIFDISWIESVASNINDDDFALYFNRVFNVVSKFFISISICLITCIPFIFPILINKKFALGYDLIPITIISTIFNTIQGLIAVIYAGKKNTKSIANTSVVSAFINIIVHLSLIKFIGLFAAAISTLISFISLSLYRMYDVTKKYVKIKVDSKTIISFIVILIIILPLYYINNFALNFVSLLISIFYAFYLNRNSITLLKKVVTKKIKNIKEC